MKFILVHYALSNEHTVDFLLVLIELFSLGVTAEALRANICSKKAILLQWGPVYPKFRVERVAPPPTILLICKLG